MPKLAIIQMPCSADMAQNISYASNAVREAASHGAEIILLPELFENVYFPQLERTHFFTLAHSVDNHPFLLHFQALAQELRVVLPISFFERANQAYYNSLCMIDADGAALGVYRKSHIPDGPGYEEKFYFNGGDTGFKVWHTHYGKIGVGICWDQWFPEAARIMALQGAELLLYPTAIGSEPEETASEGEETLDTRAMWQRAMLGHAVSNCIYVAAANRIGTEYNAQGGQATFYGSSFISDYTGEVMAQADAISATILYAELDVPAARDFRAGFGFFRDRRPALYKALLTLDGIVDV